MKIFRGNSLEIKSHNFHIINIHMIFLIHMINPIHLMVNSISIHSLYLIHYKGTKKPRSWERGFYYEYLIMNEVFTNLSYVVHYVVLVI